MARRRKKVRLFTGLEHFSWISDVRSTQALCERLPAGGNFHAGRHEADLLTGLPTSIRTRSPCLLCSHPLCCGPSQDCRNREHMQRDRLRDMRQAPTVYKNHVAPPSGRTPVPSTPTRCSMTCQCLPLTGTVPVAPGGGLPWALRPKTSPAGSGLAATSKKTTGDLATR